MHESYRKHTDKRLQLLEDKEAKKLQLFEELDSELVVSAMQELKGSIADLDDKLNSLELTLSSPDKGRLEEFKAKIEGELRALSEAQDMIVQNYCKALAEHNTTSGRLEHISLRLEKLPTWAKVEKYCAERLQDHEDALKASLADFQSRSHHEEGLEALKSDQFLLRQVLEGRLSVIESKVEGFISQTGPSEDPKVSQEPYGQGSLMQHRLDALEHDNSKVQGLRTKLVETMKRLRLVENKLKETETPSSISGDQGFVAEKGSDSFVDDGYVGRMVETRPNKLQSPKKQLDETIMPKGSPDRNIRINAQEKPKAYLSKTAETFKSANSLEGRTPKSTEELRSYLPPEAESMVLASILERTNRSRQANAVKPSTNHSIAVTKAKAEAKVTSEGGPSRELIATLRSRGLFI